MPTKRQLKQRQTQRFTGGSELAAAVGADPLRTPADIALLKLRLINHVELERRQRNQALMEVGRRFEQPIGKWFADTYGAVRRNVRAERPDLYLAVHTDFVLCSDRNPVEAKTSGLAWKLSEHWGEPGTDQIPQRSVVQCYGHMAAHRKQLCYVPAFLPGRLFCCYVVEWQEKIADAIFSRNVELWEKYILQGVIPPDSMPTMEYVQAIRRQPKQLVEIPRILVTEWAAARDVRLGMEREEERCKRAVLLALNGCDGGTIDGKLRVTNYEWDHLRMKGTADE